ncbi:amidohydrolase [Aestuariivirga sp.]|jgi:predicted amidohydrolase YtcJ|uniref:amidohydrolase n=1 Tax=Aestuariivirga sp. TaxID=2650926 RepID=UPI003783A57E
MSKTPLAAFAVALLLSSSALAADAPGASPEADSIYFGGDILTMAGKDPSYVEALVVDDGEIIFAGTKLDAMGLRGPDTRLIDLQGHTLLPGFIDTHGHMIYFGKNMIDADLFGTLDIPELIARMKVQAAKTPPGDWIVGFGYGARNLKEGRAPTIEELNEVSADRPVLIVDSSGHLGSANSALYRLAGVSAATPDPEGGSFARKPGSSELAGPMEETALNMVRKQRPPFTGELADRVATGAVELWASYGQTTASECGLGLGDDDVDIVRNAIDKNLLKIDLYVCAKDSVADKVIDAGRAVAAEYADAEVADRSIAQQDLIAATGATAPGDTARKLLQLRPDLDKRYINRVRLGGIKFWLDGSIDTAWFTQPYTNNPPGKTGVYSGFQQIPDEVLDAAFDRFWTSGIQINMHMNGDAAVEQALRAIEKAVAKYGMRDHRPVFIHATYMRPDQIKRMQQYGGIPSYLTSSLVSGGAGALFLWGGERGNKAVAANTLEQMGIPFTFSHDAPVSPQPWILTLVDAGVNRATPDGVVIGPKERVTPYVALKAVTAYAAHQIKEEDTKGTLEMGKLADMVILEQNPLKVDPKTIKDIRVLETIKEGATVFSLAP